MNHKVPSLRQTVSQKRSPNPPSQKDIVKFRCFNDCTNAEISLFPFMYPDAKNISTKPIIHYEPCQNLAETLLFPCFALFRDTLRLFHIL